MNLVPSNSRICFVSVRSYGLPKVHKEGVLLRPIPDKNSSPYHMVAKCLTELVQPVRLAVSKHSLRDTFDFVVNVRNLGILGKPFFLFDVTSLPTGETIDYLCEPILEYGIDVSVPVDELRQLLFTSTQSVPFKFDA